MRGGVDLVEGGCTRWLHVHSSNMNSAMIAVHHAQPMQRQQFVGWAAVSRRVLPVFQLSAAVFMMRPVVCLLPRCIGGRVGQPGLMLLGDAVEP